ncbi:hypothetical protein DPM13_09410 [Paracoccus mutanolyticus]|uniref:EF-hand domain-containing protein n=1 Tax=Paracoccus mutanolyticus TaxID=1499308 RepID=A0ABM6WRG5_9RHOB|nr:hypothetical protein DPM13_09410 [Paracoccus mutanolyticus]
MYILIGADEDAQDRQLATSMLLGCCWILRQHLDDAFASVSEDCSGLIHLGEFCILFELFQQWCFTWWS